MKKLTLELLDYHQWANMKILNHISQLSENVFLQEAEGTFSSISAVFAHIYMVDSLWFRRLNAQMQNGKRDSEFRNTGVAIQDLSALNKEMVHYIDEFYDELTEVIYFNSEGTQFKNHIDEVVRHLCNHGTYHRGNTATMIRQLGYKGISSDYIFYLRTKR
ncbi:DinB family protein [Metabacillus sp. RGM 3146]|uniref:DinB family protein n=1 Tax=Metabacillus sp. RGM 3146 TaxID=3401092 RepID=UPI003B99B0E6